MCRVCGNSTGSGNLPEELHRRDEGDGSSSSTNADENTIMGSQGQGPYRQLQLHQTNGLQNSKLY